MADHHGAAARAALNRSKALDLRVGGASYRAIGEALGVSGKTAHGYVQKELDKLARVTGDSAASVRELELQRIDRATFGLWPMVQQGDPASVRAWVRLSERRARLLGLDAPVKIAPTNPAGDAPYAPPALQDAHQRFNEIIGAAIARVRAQEPKQVGAGQTDAAAAADDGGEAAT